MKGTYSLLIKIKAPFVVKIGRLGKIEFKKGGYAYIGSALKNLESRVKRHLRDEKNLYWHIDYLLTESSIEEVIYVEGSEREECKIAKILDKTFSRIENFGSSDCSCKSHLLHAEKYSELKEKLISSFKQAGLTPKRWEDGKEMAK